MAYEEFDRPHSLVILDDKIFVGDRFRFHIQVFEISDLFSVETSIPDWIKNNAAWWADGSIDDASFLEGISYLIQNNIIVIPPTDAGTESSGTVPEWVKNTAGWWANETIDDGTFVNAIQYLIQEGLIRV